MSVPQILRVCLIATCLGCGTGCMRGMSYRIPMPASLTIGTMDADTTTASARKTSRPATSLVDDRLQASQIESRFVATAQ